MAETYCGKTCAQCAEKEILSCPGCKFGPARHPDGDCALALCCKKKGHEDCTTCSYNGTCPTLRGKDRMPEYRMKAIEAERVRTAALAKRAPIFGRWLWVLFWLVVPSVIITALAANLDDETGIIGGVLEALYSLAYGAVLIRLSFEEEKYRTAGFCVWANGALRVVLSIPGISGNPAWLLLIGFVAIGVSLFGSYKEFSAHSAVVVDLDSRLADKWGGLFKWLWIAVLALLGGVLLMLISPFLSVLVNVPAFIGVFVIGILKLVYLYNTAKLFRKYIQQEICQTI